VLIFSAFFSETVYICSIFLAESADALGQIDECACLLFYVPIIRAIYTQAFPLVPTCGCDYQFLLIKTYTSRDMYCASVLV
jgi:hypothetical protein